MALLKQNIDGAQTFFLDAKFANDSENVNISSVDMFFKFKPDRLSLTGQPEPGVTLFIAPTKYGVPLINRTSGLFTGRGITRVSHKDVITSSDASQPTKFEFPDPVMIKTNQEYAFCFSYDISAEFTPWTSVTGELLLPDETRISPGPSNQFIGKYYDFTSLFIAENDDSSLDGYIRSWREISDTSLKFNINLARYAIDGVPITETATTKKIYKTLGGGSELPTTSNSTVQEYEIPMSAYEYISFDENESSKAEFTGGQLAFQNTFHFPGGWASGNSWMTFDVARGNNHITANSEYPNGASFSWEDIFSDNNGRRYIVIQNPAHTKTNVRRIRAIVSNTVAELVEPPTFTTAQAKIMVTPTGLLSHFQKESVFDKEDSMVFLSKSTANSTVRFVNNSIETANIDVGGTGFSNDEVLYITGYEELSGVVEGGYPAIANLVTNSTGGITGIHFSNIGCGFVNASAIEYVFANSSQIGNVASNTANGTGATISVTTGATIKTEYGNNVFKNTVPINLDIGEFTPFHRVFAPPGVTYSTTFKTNYYKETSANTLSGYAYYIKSPATEAPLRLNTINRTQQYSKTPVLMSKSNEFNVKYTNGNVNDRIPNTAATYSNSALIALRWNYSSDYTTFVTGRPSLQFTKYIINNDATNEHTDSGNAKARHISKIIPFDRAAEDLRLYLTAYKPANTDIKAYARLYNSEDSEAFDQKNWTELELIDGTSIVSSSTDENDYIELTYGIYNIPKDRTKLDGTIEIANNSATISGVGTDFSTDLAAGDLVYMYQPLFPDNYMIASVVSVANTTSMDVDVTTTNNSIISDGMFIEKVTYPRQAFINPLNDNIVRYYNQNFQSFDGYDSLAIKLVYLSDTLHKVPRVDDVRGIGVSA